MTNITRTFLLSFFRHLHKRTRNLFAPSKEFFSFRSTSGSKWWWFHYHLKGEYLLLWMSLSSGRNVCERQKKKLVARFPITTSTHLTRHTLSKFINIRVAGGWGASFYRKKKKNFIQTLRDGDEKRFLWNTRKWSEFFRFFFAMNVSSLFRLWAQHEKSFPSNSLFVNIFFFPFLRGQLWRWFIYYSRVLCHLLSTEILFFATTFARVENLLQRFFVSFRCLWRNSYFALTQQININGKKNKSIAILFVCMHFHHLIKPRDLKCENEIFVCWESFRRF